MEEALRKLKSVANAEGWNKFPVGDSRRDAVEQANKALNAPKPKPVVKTKTKKKGK